MQPPIGVLLLQVGTPDAPTVPAVRRYLREFLGDRRVIETPRLLWWFILNFSILRTRPAQSAAKYQRIWDPQTGSPLRFHTENLVSVLRKAMPEGLEVRYAMRYGRPSTREVLRQWVQEGLERLIAVPMYPQYSGTTTGAALDALFDALKKERRVPAVRIAPPYYAHPAYIDALAGIIREEKAKLLWEPEYYLVSFHGIPEAYVQRGDPYAEHVKRTTELLVQGMGWRADQWSQSYQSILGKQPWLRPYTEATLEQLAKRGIRRVLTTLPGFTADCLETIDEVGREAREVFAKAGGQELHRCPCLNDHPLWVQALRTIVLEELKGWLNG